MGARRLSYAHDRWIERTNKEVKLEEDRKDIINLVVNKGRDMKTDEIAEILKLDLAYVNNICDKFDDDLDLLIYEFLHSKKYRLFKWAQKLPIIGKKLIKWEDSIEPL